jgi:hypothetical protein
MPRNLLGKVKLGEGAGNNRRGQPGERESNLTGKDVINAAYADAKRPTGLAKLNSRDG